MGQPKTFYARSTDLSIIVCCYNGDHTLAACLASLKVINTNKYHIEVILVDDGSTDGTRSIISNFIKNKTGVSNPIFSYYAKKNEGLSSARNYGIQHANSSLVSFVDQDAIVDLNFAVKVIELFKHFPQYNCVAGKIELLNDHEEFARLLQFSIFSYSMRSENAIIGTNMSFRKSVLKEIGGFEHIFTYRGDESALFAKSRGKIQILKSDDVIVKHPQPNNLKAWMKTRYENGFFGSAIHHMQKWESGYPYIAMRGPVSLLLLPPILGLLIIANINIISISLVLLIYLMILYKKFLHSKLIGNIVKEHFANCGGNRHGYISVKLAIIIIAGYHAEAFGYIRGFMHWRNTWK